VVIVWELDRLSRSLKDLLHIMERTAQAEAGFRSLTEAIDTTTPAGRMRMVGSFAELERAMLHERTQAGLAAPPRSSLSPGIPPVRRDEPASGSQRWPAAGALARLEDSSR